MGNLIIAMIAVAFAAALAIAGASYINPTIAVTATASSALDNETTQVLADFQNLKSTVQHTPTATDFQSVFGASSPNSSYSYTTTANGLQVSRPSAFPGTSGWVLNSSCGANASCFCLTVSNLASSSSAAVYRAVLNAAKKQVTTASNSMIGLQTDGQPCSAAAASTKYTTWPSTPPQSYTLVVSMTGAASTPSCFCTDSGTTYACGAGWEDSTPDTHACPAGETGTETRDQQTAETCVNGTVTTGAVTYTPWNTSGCATVVNGQCNATTVNTPSPTEPSGAAALCTKGLPGGVSEVGTNWDWTCEGENGGADSPLCVEKAIIAGQCNAATEATATYAAPTTNLCVSPGAHTTPTTAGTNWSWTCDGSNTGGDAACASPEIFNGTCGTSLDSCSPSQVTASNEQDVGGKSSWDCDGIHGGTSQTGCFVCDSGYHQVGSGCVANPVDGACGSDQGQYYATGPWSVDPNDLCSAGTATNGSASNNNWTWTCTGSSGGSGASCSAYEEIAGQCGSAQYTCAAGTPANGSDVNGESTWTCDGINRGANMAGCYSCDAGYSWNGSSCVAIAVNGACGSDANGQAFSSGPWAVDPNDLCTAGTAANGSASNNNWTWTCNGSGGGSTANCSAPEVVNGSCGGDVNQSWSYAPWSTNAAYAGLCSTGTPANGTTSGSNYVWTCNGANGGNNAPCSAPEAATPVNGACGTAQYTCDAGSAANGTDSNGTSTWVCNGSNGGSNSGTCTSCDSGYTWNGSVCVGNAACPAGTAYPPGGNTSSWPALASQTYKCTVGTVGAKFLIPTLGRGANGWYCNSGSTQAECATGSNCQWNNAQGCQ